MDIISMAQQARPNDIGQIELRRAQLTTLSSEAKRMPSSLRKFSSSPGFSRVTPFASSTAILVFCAFGRGFAKADATKKTAQERSRKQIPRTAGRPLRKPERGKNGRPFARDDSRSVA